MKKPLIVANWKLYVTDLESAVISAKAVARAAGKTGADLVICPPTPFISNVAKAVGGKGIAVGAQASSVAEGEKHTGETTAEMLRSAGASYVIVGHSERRAEGEDGEKIAVLLEDAVAHKLVSILCIGEKMRDQGGEHFAVLETQLRDGLSRLSSKDAKRLVVAYEPVWAIGKSAADAMDTRALEETILYIRKVLAELLGRAPALSAPILYGGSVEPANAQELMSAGVSGFLVGHASVEPSSLIAIAKASFTKSNNGTKKR
jgi:triosephosphate isomerase